MLDQRRRVVETAAMSELRTAVVTDTTEYLPAEMLRARSIHRVSLYVTLDGQTRKESEISDYASYYARLRASDTPAKTSAPSIGDFVAVYEPLLAAGMEVVSLHISSGISATCENAGRAKQQLIDEGRGGERIHVFDSRSTAGGLGMLCLVAADVAEAGGDAAVVVASLERARAELHLWFAVDTLDYLRIGGRIGAAQVWLGSALQIKPILTVAEQVFPIERVRTRRRAFERLVEYGRELKAGETGRWVVQHIQDPQAAEHLVERGREIFGTEPLFVSEIGPVIGTHAGPGLLGIGGHRDVGRGEL